MAGDVRRSIGPVEPAREIDPGDVNGSGAVPPGHLRVQGQLAGNGSTGPCQTEIRVERRQWTLQRGVEVRFNRDVLQTGHQTGPFLKGERLGMDGEIENRRTIADEHLAAEYERRPWCADGEPIEKPAVGAPTHRARETGDGQFRGMSDPRRAIEHHGPLHRFIGKRKRRVERPELGRYVGRTELKRVAQRDAGVDELDRLDLDRSAGSGPLLLPGVAFDQRAEVPAAIRQFRGHDSRPGDDDAPDHGAVLPQLARAVVEPDRFDLDHGMAVARESHVAEFQTAEQRSPQPSDLEADRQVLIGLLHDQRTELVLAPPGFDDADDDPAEREDDGNQDDEGASQGDDERAGASKMRHQCQMVSTCVPDRAAPDAVEAASVNSSGWLTFPRNRRCFLIVRASSGLSPQPASSSSSCSGVSARPPFGILTRHTRRKPPANRSPPVTGGRRATTSSRSSTNRSFSPAPGARHAQPWRKRAGRPDRARAGDAASRRHDSSSSRGERHFERWNGTLTTTVFGRKSSAPLISSARWLWSRCCHQRAGTNSGRMTVT